jgi:DNA ligase-4
VQSSRAAGTRKADARDLNGLFTSLTARDAKWFSRLILKDFTPVVLDEQAVCKAYNPNLPQALAIRDDFAAALSLLRESNDASRPKNLIKLGVKIGRQPWLKARSIKHCADMIDRRQISCEQKIDGEYCQIHVDVSKPPGHEIQIFSKSGKDSTKDRQRLHR